MASESFFSQARTVEYQLQDLQRASGLVSQGDLEMARKIASSYDTTNDAAVRGMAAELLERIERAEVVDRANAAARLALDDVRAYRADHPNDLREIRRRLDAIVTADVLDAELLDSLRRQREETQRAIDARERTHEKQNEELRSRAAALSGAIEEVDAHLAALRFVEARDRATELRTSRPELAAEAEILERKVLDATWSHYRSELAAARDLVAAGDLERAAERIGPAPDRYPIESIRAEAEAFLAEVARRIAERDDEEEAALAEADRVRRNESFDRAKTHIEALDIPRAIEVLEAGRSSLSGRAYHKNFDIRIAHLQRIADLLARIRRHVADHPDRRLRTSHTDYRSWVIVGADEAGIRIRDTDSGQAEFKKPWARVGAKEIRKIFRQIEPLSARDRLRLYALCKEFPEVGSGAADEEEKEAMRLLELDGDPETRAAFEDYRTHGW